MAEKKYNVVGIGNAIVDVVVYVEDDFLAVNDLEKGIMKIVEEDQIKKLHSKIDMVKQVSGGSAANTISGLAILGNSVAFIGKVKNDRLGRSFEKSLKELGVTYRTTKSESAQQPTASCVILTTPDAQRTMNTCLGISGSLGPEDIDRKIVSDSEIIYLEGYLWDRPEAKKAFLKATEIAREQNEKVALSLSDPFCVNRHRIEFLELVNEKIDILFANEEEIKSLFKMETFGQVVKKCKGHSIIFALTRGKEGSTIIFKKQILSIPAEKDVKVIDTTGAGDMFAAGFLHGYIKGMDLYSCAEIGNILAAGVIGSTGARPESSLKKMLEKRGFSK